MTRIPAEEPIDERLRQLLEVERRLEERVLNAAADAAERVASARSEGEREQAKARQRQAAADDEQLREELDAQALALADIQDHHAADLRETAGVSDRRIDELARRALDRVIDAGGGAT